MLAIILASVSYSSCGIIPDDWRVHIGILFLVILRSISGLCSNIFSAASALVMGSPFCVVRPTPKPCITLCNSSSNIFAVCPGLPHFVTLKIGLSSSLLSSFIISSNLSSAVKFGCGGSYAFEIILCISTFALRSASRSF